MSWRAEQVRPELSRDLRRRVLRPAAGPGDRLPGDDLAGAVHFAAFDDHRRLVGTCFVYEDADPAAPDERGWHLRQMATEPDVRGQGAGATVLQAVVEFVADAGGGRLWCNARESAVGFYARHGLRAEGDIYPDGPSGAPPIPHRRMWRAVAPAHPAQPADPDQPDQPAAASA